MITAKILESVDSSKNVNAYRPSTSSEVNIIPFTMRGTNGKDINLYIVLQHSSTFVCSKDIKLIGSEPDYTVWKYIAMTYGFIGSWQITSNYTDSFYHLCSYVADDCSRVMSALGGGVISISISGKPLQSDVVEFFSDNYEKRNIYSGKHSYHTSHQSSSWMNNPIVPYKYRMGIELEIVAKDELKYRKLTRMRSNVIFMESDSSLPSLGIECISIPLLPSDATNSEFWRKWCADMNKYAKSWERPECGLHIHVSREAFGDSTNDVEDTVGKLLYLYNYHLIDDSMNVNVFGRSYTYNVSSNNSIKVREGNAVEVLGAEVLSMKTVRDKVMSALKRKQNETRYVDINFQNSKTIEFRRGKGTINQYHIAAMCEYVDLMIKYCKQVAWKNISKDNFLEYVSKHWTKKSGLDRYIHALNGGER